MNGLIKQVGGILLFLLSIFTFGYFKGRGREKSNRLKKDVKNAKKAKNRKAKRRFSPKSVIKSRMRKYVRK
jgi:hypothetical protein